MTYKLICVSDTLEAVEEQLEHKNYRKLTVEHFTFPYREIFNKFTFTVCSVFIFIFVFTMQEKYRGIIYFIKHPLVSRFIAEFR